MTGEIPREERTRIMDLFIREIAPYVVRNAGLAEEIKALIDFYQQYAVPFGTAPELTEEERSQLRIHLKRQCELLQRADQAVMPPPAEDSTGLRMAAEENTLQQRLAPRLIGFRCPLLPDSPYHVTLEIQDDEIYLVFLCDDRLTSELDGCSVIFRTSASPGRCAESVIKNGQVRVDFATLGLEAETFEQVAFEVSRGEEVLHGTLSG